MNDRNAPAISVVIPLYNKAPHVSRAIRSVLGQTFADFELLVIDDASTDTSLIEVQKFVDPRIRLLHREQPGPGGYAARNLGIREARAEWVAFLDADDEWYPDHLDKMFALSVKFPDVFLLGCGWHTREGDALTVDRFFAHRHREGDCLLDVQAYLAFCSRNMRPVHTCAAIVRKTSQLAPDLFPAATEARRGGDLHAWLKLICHHGRMAWSSHVGALYYRDSVNMVTRLAPSTAYLMSREIYRELATKLGGTERVLLGKYFNQMLKDAWLGNLKREQKNFRLWSKLYWRGDFRQALLLAAFSTAPHALTRRLLHLKAILKPYYREWIAGRAE
jgi:glycosyltransferase involved in cell wall biosynthesis